MLINTLMLWQAAFRQSCLFLLYFDYMGPLTGLQHTSTSANWTQMKPHPVESHLLVEGYVPTRHRLAHVVIVNDFQIITEIYLAILAGLHMGSVMSTIQLTQVVHHTRQLIVQTGFWHSFNVAHEGCNI